VQKVRAPQAAPVAVVPAARVAPIGPKEPPAAAPLAPSSAGGLGNVRPAREAWELLAAPLRRGKGIRLTIYGITGKGKTTGLIDFLAFILGEGLVDLVIVHDVKFRDVQQYEGAVIHEGRDIYTDAHAPRAYPATVVLRKTGLDHMPSVDAAARVALESADQGLRVVFIVDEFARAIEEDIPGGFRKGSTNRIACEGFGLGASLIALKQLPQFMPPEVRTQSELIMFGIAGDGLSHLVDERAIPKSMAEKVARLPVGHFMIKPSEGEPDGLVYKVPAP
jgi:hypothetical protein